MKHHLLIPLHTSMKVRHVSQTSPAIFTLMFLQKVHIKMYSSSITHGLSIEPKQPPGHVVWSSHPTNAQFFWDLGNLEANPSNPLSCSPDCSLTMFAVWLKETTAIRKSGCLEGVYLVYNNAGPEVTQQNIAKGITLPLLLLLLLSFPDCPHDGKEKVINQTRQFFVAPWSSLVVDKGRHRHSDRSAATHPQTQQAVMHLVSWYHSSKASRNFPEMCATGALDSHSSPAVLPWSTFSGYGPQHTGNTIKDLLFWRWPSHLVITI